MNKNPNLEETMLKNMGEIQSKIFQFGISFSARYIEYTARQCHLVKESRKICAIFNELH